MSGRSKSQASVPRTRPAGDRRIQQPACTLEDPGVRRNTRSHSNVAPTPPRSLETRRSCKASTADGKQGAMNDSGPSGATEEKLSAHGGEADLSEEGWGLQRPRESITTYGSRVMSHLREYEEASKTTRRLREELRCAHARAEGAPKKKKPAILAEIKMLEEEIQRLEDRKTLIRDSSGPFKEKLLNEDRFRNMAEKRLKGLQPESQVVEDGDQQQEPPDSLQSQQQDTCSGLPAGQAPVTSQCGSVDLGEDSDTSAQGGALMAQIKLLESPVHLQDFCFGDELPEEEAPGGSHKQKAKKTRPKLQEVVSYVYGPLPVSPESAAGPARCASPVVQPSPGSVVDLVHRHGEMTESGSVALSSVSACSSRDAAGKASAERPDNKGGPAAGIRSSSGAEVCSLVGGGSVPVPESAAVASVAPSSVAADHLVEKRRQSEGAAGAPRLGPPASTVPKSTILFCIGANSRDSENERDQRRPEKDQRRPLQVSEKRTKRKKVSDGEEEYVTGPAGMDGSVTGAAVGVNDTNIKSSSLLCGGVSGGEGAGVAVGEGNSGDVGVGAGTGPVAPPAVTDPARSYVSVAAGGGRASSSLSSYSGDGVLQRRLLEALRKGESSITVEGKEVNLSFWIERHGLRAFREERGGETGWSLPTAGPGVRRNVVRLRWEGSDACPPRAKVVELLLKMGFKAVDIYALIHPYGTPEFDVSFVRPEGLELFWSNYELAKNEPGWRDFAVQAVSRQNEVKRVPVITRNESLSCYDIVTWLGRYGEVLEVPKKNRDEFGIWSGSWTFMVKLKRSGNSVAHIPSSAFLGRDRILIFYQGQPKLCHRCGDPTHFSANCTVQKCALCGGVGHLAASCTEIRCHLCGDLGHPFSRCPRSFANAVRTPARGSREDASAGEGTSRGEGTEGPRRESKKKTPAQLRRLDKRQKERKLGESEITGVSPGPVLEADHATEALRDDVLDEEVRRIQAEEVATSSESSHYESMGEDDRKWLEEKRKQGAKKKKKRDVRSSPTLVQVPKEGNTDCPLVDLSNRFQALDNISSSSSDEEAEGEGPEVAAVRPAGGAESSSEGKRFSVGETGLESGDKDEESKKVVGMDTSVSLKRGKGSCSDTEDKGGSEKKKAV